MKPGDIVKARVIAAKAYGIHLKYEETEILVKVTDVPWGESLSPAEYASIGDTLEVTILDVFENGAVIGWLPDKREDDGKK